MPAIATCWFFATVITLHWAFLKAQEPVIQTPLGPVMGKHIKSYNGRTVSAFEGIPYAKPPIGQLRFAEPQPIEPWKDVLVANKSYTCMQYTAIQPKMDVVGDEDCLYLYVYVPRAAINGNESLDVVVHIHGGAFTIGDPTSIAGPKYIMDRDLVYVSMSYRLGILGFLSTGDDVVSGNNAMKDQVQALKWVQENIRSFGGNPNSVTIVGASSGAACVHFHYLSPLSKGLFHRGFSQSGTVLNYWALSKDPLKNAKQLGSQLNCEQNTTKALVECLRGKSGREITLQLSKFLYYVNSLPVNQFVPVIESGANAFLSEHPYKLLMQGKINNVPWVTSNVKDDGVIPVGVFILYGKLPELEVKWSELAAFTLGYDDIADEGKKELIGQKIKEHYLRNESVSNQNIFDLIKLYSDRFFISNAVTAAHLQASIPESKVYYYFFDYHTEVPNQYRAGLPVVAHGDDVKVLYHQTSSPEVLSDSDRKMKDIFVDFLYNFAKTGIPTMNGLEWKPVGGDKEEIVFMHISSPDNIHLESSKEIGDLRFWESLPLKENEKSL